MPRFAFLQDYGTRDVGRHQVGRKLYAFENKIEDPGNGTDEHGFAQSGHTFDQTMAAGQNRVEHRIDVVFLPEDRLANFGVNRLAVFAQRREQLGDIFLGNGNSGWRGIFARRRNRAFDADLGVRFSHRISGARVLCLSIFVGTTEFLGKNHGRRVNNFSLHYSSSPARSRDQAISSMHR